MRAVYRLEVGDTLPDRKPVLRSQGIPSGADPGPRIDKLVDSAIKRYLSLAEPRAVVEEITQSDFATVYQGRGRNEPSTPLASVYPRGDHLSLFAVTLGPAISREISSLFFAHDLALGAFLDAAASVGADRAAEATARRYLGELKASGVVSPSATVLPYSPGYCGWHITAQKMLFTVLRPEEVGITLRPSCLMEPLKSVTGLLVIGPEEIHDFDDDYELCSECATRECRGRIPLSDYVGG